ncbi:uncharacterized protein LOC143671564 [Tamandua tetradactyla]|uniref:uncharacterized protein LOC143671564 n=1 Tax=Tamandua tetradactyla TaxID=48850 RepID=UPI0040545670
MTSAFNDELKAPGIEPRSPAWQKRTLPVKPPWPAPYQVFILTNEVIDDVTTNWTARMGSAWFVILTLAELGTQCSENERTFLLFHDSKLLQVTRSVSVAGSGPNHIRLPESLPRAWHLLHRTRNEGRQAETALAMRRPKSESGVPWQGVIQVEGSGTSFWSTSRSAFVF